MHQDRVLALVELIYDAAADPASWNRVVEEVMSLTGGIGADLAAVNSGLSKARIQAGVGIVNADFKRDYEAVSHLDPFLVEARARGLFRAGVVGIGDAVVPFRELERTEFYSVFGRRHDYNGGLVAVVAADAGAMTALAVTRHPERLFGDREARLMRTLLPHFQRAWHLHLRLTEANRQRAAFEETLNRLALGVVVVGRLGTVTFANDAARTMLAARDGLTVDRGALRGSTPQETSALNAVVTRALMTANKEGLEGGGVVRLGRPSGRRALRAIVSPLPANEKLGVAEPSVLVFVSDPDAVQEPDAAILRGSFGLTPAEVEVATLLLQDKSVKEISDWLGVTTHAVRFHLKQLFAKTGTTRQSSLVRLLSATAQIRRT
jgi:DNA-binding CsgD family transcriptional regulator